MFHFNKVAGLATQLFSCEKFLRTPILKNNCERLLLWTQNNFFSSPSPPPPHPPQKKERKRKTQKRPLEKSLE